MQKLLAESMRGHETIHQLGATDVFFVHQEVVQMPAHEQIVHFFAR